MLDIDRSVTGFTEQSIFHALASNRRLTNLTINFDHLIDAESRKTLPLEYGIRNMSYSIQSRDKIQRNPFDPCTVKWLQNIWSVLQHERRQEGTRPLRELQVKIGEWPARQPFDPASRSFRAPFKYANRRYYLARGSDRDDQENEVWTWEVRTGDPNVLLDRDMRIESTPNPASIIVGEKDEGSLADFLIAEYKAARRGFS